jgi:hypothetical protein
MSPDTCTALVLTAGVCGGLTGILAGALFAWWPCAVTIRNLSAANHGLRRQLLAHGGAVPSPTGKPQPAGGRLIRQGFFEPEPPHPDTPSTTKS